MSQNFDIGPGTFFFIKQKKNIQKNNQKVTRISPTSGYLTYSHKVLER